MLPCGDIADDSLGEVHEYPTINISLDASVIHVSVSEVQFCAVPVILSSAKFLKHLKGAALKT